MKSTPSRGGKKCFINFIDNCTRYCYVYLLNGKDEAIETYWQYKTEVENQLDKKIVMIRSGRCGEYESSSAEIYLENGIIHQITAHSHLNLMKLLTGKKLNFEGNVECPIYKFRFTTKFVGGAIIIAKENNNKKNCLFRKRETKSFVC